jgi:hypothetical protein
VGEWVIHMANGLDFRRTVTLRDPIVCSPCTASNDCGVVGNPQGSVTPVGCTLGLAALITVATTYPRSQPRPKITVRFVSVVVCDANT